MQAYRYIARMAVRQHYKQMHCGCQGHIPVSTLEREMHWCTALKKTAKLALKAV